MEVKNIQISTFEENIKRGLDAKILDINDEKYIRAKQTKKYTCILTLNLRRKKRRFDNFYLLTKNIITGFLLVY